MLQTSCISSSELIHVLEDNRSQNSADSLIKLLIYIIDINFYSFSFEC